MNKDAVIGMSIVTAFHQRGWAPNTTPEECEHDFREIERLVYHNLDWAGITDVVIRRLDIVEAIWGDAE